MKYLFLVSFYFLIINSIFSQSNYSEKELNEMYSTYAFCIGQETLINTIIQNYPSLKLDAIEALNKWNYKFNSTIMNIVEELKETLGNEKFDLVYEELYRKAGEISISINSIEEAKDLISKINDRTNGNIPSPFLETLLIFNSTYQKYPEREISDGYFYEYFTNQSIKSEGLNIKIKYPKSWVNKEGDRPHVIQKFISKHGDGLELVSIMIEKMDFTPTKEEIESILLENNLKTQLPENSKLISINSNLKIDNLNAASITFYCEYQQMNLNIGMITESYYFIYKNYQISLMFYIGSNSNDYKDIFNRYLKYKNTAYLIANSIVILSKYEKE